MIEYLKIKFFYGKNNIKYLLIFLFVLSFLLRICLINTNLFFGPEQGRDMLVVRNIIENHKLVLIGSKTDIGGIFHGPIFYYLSVIPFLISNGNPIVISIFFIFLNSLAIFPLYFLVKELFEKKTALIASVIFTFSFGSIVFARWLSNPPLTILLSGLLMWSFVKFLKGKDHFIFLTAIFFILIGQVEFINFLLFGVLLILFGLVFRNRFIKLGFVKLFLTIGLGVIGSVLNYLVFDLRHNFLISKSIYSLFTKHSGFYGTFASSITASVSNFLKILTDTLAPDFLLLAMLVFIGGLLVLARQIKSNKKSAFLMLIWLFSPFLIFFLLKYNPLYHYFAAYILTIIIVCSLLIKYVLDKSKFLGILFLIGLVLINMISLSKNLPVNKNVFFQSTQEDLRYVDQMSVIDKIYKISGSTQFFYQSYTIPYWQQAGWQYLFWYFANSNNKTIPTEKNYKELYVIIQNDPRNTYYQQQWLKNTVFKWGIKVGEFKFGALKVLELKV